MQIYLIAVGKKMPAWINDGYAEFSKRMPAELRLKLIEIVAVKRNKTSSIANTLHKEGQLIQSAIPKRSKPIVLDETGQSLSSIALAEKMQHWLTIGQDISLIIGGADGLEEQIKKNASELWSLSCLTLPHALVRVVLAEQLYRAWSILQHHPYHRQ